MAQTKRVMANHTTTEPPVWVDRMMRIVIFGGGVLVLALLAWGHLGLGALVRPPAPTALQQTAQVGPYAVAFRATGQMSARDVNAATFSLHDASGAALTNAQVRVTFAMVDMPMTAPDAPATMQADGTYLAHLRFSMAGTWHVTVHIATPGQPEQSAIFTVSVRWT